MGSEGRVTRFTGEPPLHGEVIMSSNTPGPEDDEPKAKPDQPEGQETGPTEEPTQPKGDPPEERKTQRKIAWWKIAKVLLLWGLRTLVAEEISDLWPDDEN